MRQIRVGFAMASGLLAGLLVYAAVAATPDSYTKVEAASLVTSPQNSWARAILFADELVQAPAGRAQRLDRKNYLPMRLKVAGTVWVPEYLREFVDTAQRVPFEHDQLAIARTQRAPEVLIYRLLQGSTPFTDVLANEKAACFAACGLGCNALSALLYCFTD